MDDLTRNGAPDGPIREDGHVHDRGHRAPVHAQRPATAFDRWIEEAALRMSERGEGHAAPGTGMRPGGPRSNHPAVTAFTREKGGAALTDIDDPTLKADPHGRAPRGIFLELAAIVFTAAVTSLGAWMLWEAWPW